MPYTVILHISGEPSIVGEVDELPKPADTIIIVSNPRLRDGKHEMHSAWMGALPLENIRHRKSALRGGFRGKRSEIFSKPIERKLNESIG